MNHLEELVSQWLEYNDDFVRRNVFVEKRAKGGYDGELDVVAFHPSLRRLVHVEASLDAQSWEKRERRFENKFAAGRRHIPNMFGELAATCPIDQIALLVFGNPATRPNLGGGRTMHVSTLYREILAGIRERRVESQAVPEQFPLIRTLQQCQQYCDIGGGTNTDAPVEDGICVRRHKPEHAVT